MNICITSVLDSPKSLQIYPRFIKRKFGISEFYV